MGLLRMRKLGERYGLSPSFFKDKLLNPDLTTHLRSIWMKDQIPKDGCKSAIVLIYKKGDGYSCKDQRNWFGKHFTEIY